jgi:YidC/Oxa1 family membrane protein insertase
VEAGSETKPSFFGGVGNETAAACDVGTDLRRHVADDKPPTEFKGPLNFFGMNQQYFLAAVYPMDGPKEARCVLSASATGRVATAFFPLDLKPGASYRQSFGVFIGPKDLDVLRATPERMKPLGFSVATAETSWSLNGSSFPHLEKAVDFGIWAFICKILLGILKFFHSLVHNWGVAIILLTVVVKLALLPATHKSMVSAEAMKKLQPKMAEIKKKYAQDKERQNVETMKLYQQEKVNPLGGCLPMLLQMPIWFALYTTLRSSYEIYREPFIAPFWADLTFRDPTYLLPVALGITQIITQRLQPQMMDAAQAKMMTYVMPVFFTLVMINYPAGLSLYIFTNNLLTVAQQYGLRRYLQKKGNGGSKTLADRNTRRDGHGRQPNRKRSDP